MPFAYRLELEDGTPADPPTLKSAVPNWRPGDTIPLGRKTLRVVVVRRAEHAEEIPCSSSKTVAQRATSGLAQRFVGSKGAGSAVSDWRSPAPAPWSPGGPAVACFREFLWPPSTAFCSCSGTAKRLTLPRL
jgi:hypothetical protein